MPKKKIKKKYLETFVLLDKMLNQIQLYRILCIKMQHFDIKNQFNIPEPILHHLKEPSCLPVGRQNSDI